jgi:hypothetical protein
MSKIQNPIKIKIKGTMAGFEAGEWCTDNLVFDDWDMWMGNSWADYTFEFANEKDATIFALKWGHFA